MHHIREMIRLFLFFCFVLLALVARFCFERVILAKVLKLLLLSLRLLFFPPAYVCNCTFVLCWMQFYHRHTPTAAVNACKFKEIGTGKKAFFFRAVFVMFRLCFHTCNGWPNELNITSVVIIPLFFSSSFECRCDLPLFINLFKWNLVHFFCILFSP